MLNITDQKKFYQRFQTSKSLRKPINKIVFNVEHNLNTNRTKINQLEIFPKTKKQQSDDFQLFLKNYNNDKKIKTFFDLKRLINEIFKIIN